MKLIAERHAKTDKYDVLRFVRDDGTSTEAAMRRQGFLPNDLVHYNGHNGSLFAVHFPT